MTVKRMIEAREVTKQFGSGATAVRAVDHVSLDVSQGELVLITGPSGSGKTTLLSMLGALLRPTSGQIYIRDIDIATVPERQLPEIRACNIGFVFQSFNLIEALTVEENVLMPASLAVGGVRRARRRVGNVLERLGLTERRRAYPGTLSGGEKQRVAIGRALINRPPLILADEPTGNLDSQRGQEVAMLLHDVARDDDCAVVIVTHDPRVEEIADRVLWLEDGHLRDRKQEAHSWVVDPVCGMRLDEWRATLRAEHGGGRYAFCSVRCHDRFIAEPSAYIRGQAKERSAS